MGFILVARMKKKMMVMEECRIYERGSLVALRAFLWGLDGGGELTIVVRLNARNLAG